MRQYAGFTIRDGAHGQQDIDVIEEVYVNDCYGLSDLFCVVVKPLILDIGAHIGTFARKAASRFPGSEIICVEACSENVPLLLCNANGACYHAACYHADEPIGLLNSIFEGGKATGGSIVKTLADLCQEENDPAEYRKDTRPLQWLTLEEVSGGRFIDLLKIDAEGSEINILGHADLNQIGTIVGEYHRDEDWELLLAARFAGWGYIVLDQCEAAGRFRLENPARCTVHV